MYFFFSTFAIQLFSTPFSTLKYEIQKKTKTKKPPVQISQLVNWGEKES